MARRARIRNSEGTKQHNGHKVEHVVFPNHTDPDEVSSGF